MTLNGLSPWKKTKINFPDINNVDFVYIAIGCANNIPQQNPPAIEMIANIKTVARLLIDPYLEEHVYYSNSIVYILKEYVDFNHEFKEYVNGLTSKKILVLIEMFTGRYLHENDLFGFENLDRLQLGLVPLRTGGCFPEITIDHYPLIDDSFSEFKDISKMNGKAIVEYFSDRLSGKSHRLHLISLFEYLKTQYSNVWSYEYRRNSPQKLIRLRDLLKEMEGIIGIVPDNIFDKNDTNEINKFFKLIIQVLE